MTIGIDIGGSKMRAVLWDSLRGRVLSAKQVKTPKLKWRAFVRRSPKAKLNKY